MMTTAIFFYALITDPFYETLAYRRALREASAGLVEIERYLDAHPRLKDKPFISTSPPEWFARHDWEFHVGVQIDRGDEKWFWEQASIFTFTYRLGVERKPALFANTRQRNMPIAFKEFGGPVVPIRRLEEL